MINLIVNGNSYSYPQPGDKANTGWGSQATNWASAVTAALTALGLGGTLTPTPNAVVDISSTTKGILVPRLTTTQRNAITSPATSLLIFNTTLGVFQYYSGSAWITIGAKIPDNVQFDGTLTVNGNISTNGGVTAVGAVTGASLNTTGLATAATANFTDATDATNATTAPVKTAGGLGIAKKLFVGTDANVGGNANVTGNTTIAGTLGVTGNTTIDGVTYLDDDTTANTPVLSFTGDTNTGIGRSAADTLDFITNGNSRFKISSTGQQSSTVPDLSGSNTTLYPEFKCRAWVNFNGTGAIGAQTIRGSGNISSVVKNGTGDYTINIDTDMPDANYSAFISAGNSAGSSTISFPSQTVLAGSIRFVVMSTAIAAADRDFVFAGIFR